MNLRNQVEWALHCVSVLAGLPRGSYVAAQTLAEFHGVPKEYLGKALQELAKAGIVEGRLGPKGGYRLAREPKEITFLDVVEAIEGRERSFRCTEIRRNSPCASGSQKYTRVCGIAQVMYAADEAYREVLRATTLADLQARLPNEVPSDLLARNLEWLSSRSS